MAYLDSTVLNDFQAREASNEKRDANYGMLNLAKDSTSMVDFVPPSVQQQLGTMSGSRNAQIPVIKDQTVTVSSTPGFSNIPINLGETGTYYFTAYDIFSGFRLYPASFENNQMDAQYYADQIMRNVLKEMAVSKDNVIKSVLEARKTQVLNYDTQISQGDGTFTFDGGTDTLNISKAAQKDTMFYNLGQLMQANQLGGNYKLVTSPAGLVINDAESLKFREGNSKDLSWQQGYMGAGDRYISDQITTSANFDGYLVQDGSIGLYSNYPWDFRNGTKVAGKEWSVSDVELPYIKSQANIFINKEATEATSLITPNTDTNLTMTHFEEMAIWDRFYVVYKYNSDLSTRVNPVVKLVGATS